MRGTPLFSLFVFATLCAAACGGMSSTSGSSTSGVSTSGSSTSGSSTSGPMTDAGSGGTGGTSGTGGTGGITCTAPPTLGLVAGPATKICQLTGELDKQLGQPTPNKTFTRFQLTGTDLGSSFEAGGKLWFLFGDSKPTAGPNPNPACGDSIAYSVDTDPTNCVKLDFVSFPSGSFKSPSVPGVNLSCFNVPLSGVAKGSSMYVWFSTDCMTRSVLARTDDGAQTFSLIGDVSDCKCGGSCVNSAPPLQSCAQDCHFVNVSASLVPPARAQGLPPANGDHVLLFGTGKYRMSDVFLSAAPLAQIEDGTSRRYFTGVDPASCAPSWGTTESAAKPIFSTAGEGDDGGSCVGEVSVHYDDVMKLWIAMYNCGLSHHNIQARAAATPWGPWSAPLTVFDAATAHCKYIYKSGAGCNSLSDPKRLNEDGAVYGPYVIGRYTKPTAQGAKLYFVMSTWNPYNTVLMEAELNAH